MNRRGFLTRSGLALGALLLGDEALDAFARLTHVRKSFPSAAVPSEWQYARVDVSWVEEEPFFVLGSPKVTAKVSRDGVTWVNAPTGYEPRIHLRGSGLYELSLEVWT